MDTRTAQLVQQYPGLQRGVENLSLYLTSQEKKLRELSAKAPVPPELTQTMRELRGHVGRMRSNFSAVQQYLREAIAEASRTGRITPEERAELVGAGLAGFVGYDEWTGASYARAGTTSIAAANAGGSTSIPEGGMQGLGLAPLLVIAWGVAIALAIAIPAAAFAAAWSATSESRSRGAAVAAISGVQVAAYERQVKALQEANPTAPIPAPPTVPGESQITPVADALTKLGVGAGTLVVLGIAAWFFLRKRS